VEFVLYFNPIGKFERIFGMNFLNSCHEFRGYKTMFSYVVELLLRRKQFYFDFRNPLGLTYLPNISLGSFTPIALRESAPMVYISMLSILLHLCKTISSFTAKHIACTLLFEDHLKLYDVKMLIFVIFSHMN